MTEEIQSRLVEQHMKEAYVDYAMSVIMARALPDVRDGLKPVHRRILYAMHRLGLVHTKPFRKSAYIVGRVLASYHPHGDAAVYDSLVRMAQDFSLRYPLVQGQGNMGCFTGDTKIKLLDGTFKGFKELCENYKQGEIIYVYSVNKEGKIVVGEGINPRLTKKNAQLVEVTLDTGEKIRCTPNHKFLLKNLQYKEAKDLTPQDSLMPGYFAVKVTFLDYTEDVYDITVREHHNFLLESGVFVHNSVDGDRQASMRYTEARLAKIADEMIYDLEKETVAFAPNYDNTTKEPLVLPTRIPNLLINGSTGIAVGMATNIPPHNIREVIDATVAMIDTPTLEIQVLLQHMKGPDFPTGGLIAGRQGILQAYATGRGKVIVKAKTSLEEQKIIVTEIPYMVNKTLLIESIVGLVKEGVIEGISDIRDESDRKGMRLVIELKKQADPQLTLQQLFAHTSLKTTFGVIMLVLKDNQPVVMNLKDIISNFIAFRKEVVTRRTQYDLRKAEERAHILEGLKIALQHIDPVIALIKGSETVEQAKQGLMTSYQLTEVQGMAILEMKLQRLTSLETRKLQEELEELLKQIIEYKSILASEPRIFEIIKKELLEIKEKYGDGRKTEIIEEDQHITSEDLIKEEDVVITLTHSGYIKQMPLTAYRQQRRGGQGVVGAEVKEEDAIKDLFVTSNRNYLLIFTNLGKVHWLKAYEIPAGGRYARGKALVNLLQLEQNEKVSTLLPVKSIDDQAYTSSHYITMITKKGILKKTDLSAYSNPRKGGIIALTLKAEDDELVEALLTDGNKKLIMATRNGGAVRFDEKDVRPMGRSAAGVRGIKLEMNDAVIGMEIADDQGSLFTITENGYGKRTAITEYRLIRRGGSGVINIKTEERNGKVVAIKSVFDDEDLLLITKQGIVMRTAVKDISVIGRNTMGMRIMKLSDNDKVMSVAKIVKEE